MSNQHGFSYSIRARNGVSEESLVISNNGEITPLVDFQSKTHAITYRHVASEVARRRKRRVRLVMIGADGARQPVEVFEAP